MDAVNSITPKVAVADCQLSSTQLQQAANAGFKSILNMRSPQEEGTLDDEQAQAEAAGMTYANVPVNPGEMSTELADQVLQTIDDLPKPVLAHCKSGMRSGAMALMYAATRNNMNAEAALQKGKQSGFDCDAHPQMKQFLVNYIDNHTSSQT